MISLSENISKVFKFVAKIFAPVFRNYAQSICIFILSRPADLTVSKRPGTSFRIEIHFAVFNRLYLLFSFIKLVETW